MTDLTKIGLRHSPLTDQIYLCRFGKDPQTALDKREAEADVFCALVEHMMFEAPNGSEKIITLGTKQYIVILKPYSPTEEIPP